MARSGGTHEDEVLQRQKAPLTGNNTIFSTGERLHGEVVDEPISLDALGEPLDVLLFIGPARIGRGGDEGRQRNAGDHLKLRSAGERIHIVP